MHPVGDCERECLGGYDMTTRMHGPSRPTANSLVSRRKVQDLGDLPRIEEDEGPSIKGTETGTIVIIDQRVLIRDCLVRCLKTANKDCIVLAFASVTDWLAAAADHPAPAVIVLCVQDRRPVDAQIGKELSILAGRGIDIPIVIISDAEDMNHVVAALENGARGYIPTSVTLDVAVEAMRLVEAGGTFAPASTMMSWKRSEISTPVQNSPAKSLFTARQAAVLAVLRQGKANKRIAYELNMREGTVKVHIRNIMKKLKAKNRTEVAILAHELFADSAES
jgi:DNA-binding NarL/FixJ family response regulator